MHIFYLIQANYASLKNGNKKSQQKIHSADWKCGWYFMISFVFR